MKFKQCIFLAFSIIFGSCSHHTESLSRSSASVEEHSEHGVHHHGAFEHSHPSKEYHGNYSIELPDDPMFLFFDNNQNGFIEESEIDFKSGPQPTQGSFSNSTFSEKAILNLGLKKGQLLLTIDDGPTPGVTSKMLDTLRDYNIKAAFFIVGDRSKISRRYSDIVRRIVDEGHTLANHTMTHKVPKDSSIVSEVKKAHRAIQNVVPGWPDQSRLYFRAPGIPARFKTQAYYLNKDKTTKHYIGPIHANIGTSAPRADWACWTKKHNISVDLCTQYYFEEINKKGRGIILLHDLRSKSAELLEKLLEKLSRRGGIKTSTSDGVWSFVNMDDLRSLDKFELNESRTSTYDDSCKIGESCTIINGTINIRELSLPSMTVFNWKRDSQYYVRGIKAKTSILQQVKMISKIKKFGHTFYRVRVEKAKGFEGLIGHEFYLFEDALFSVSVEI